MSLFLSIVFKVIFVFYPVTGIFVLVIGIVLDSFITFKGKGLCFVIRYNVFVLILALVQKSILERILIERAPMFSNSTWVVVCLDLLGIESGGQGGRVFVNSMWNSLEFQASWWTFQLPFGFVIIGSLASVSMIFGFKVLRRWVFLAISSIVLGMVLQFFFLIIHVLYLSLFLSTESEEMVLGFYQSESARRGLILIFGVLIFYFSLFDEKESVGGGGTGSCPS